MADQFDLEQGIMGCWQITSDLDVLLEELMENTSFTQDQASNFVLGLSTIYEAKFDKLFRTFEDFLKQYYQMRDDRNAAINEAHDLQQELDLATEANELLDGEQPEFVSLDQLFDEEEERLALLDENDRLDFDLVEDEFGFR
jgi:cell division protein ZapA (FtsZ GTPase activity inhibitor)